MITIRWQACLLALSHAEEVGFSWLCGAFASWDSMFNSEGADIVKDLDEQHKRSEGEGEEKLHFD